MLDMAIGQWPPFFIVISVAMAAFLIYLKGSALPYLSISSHQQKDAVVNTQNPVLRNRIFGFFCYGGIPFLAIIFLLADHQFTQSFGLSPVIPNLFPSLYWLAGLIPFMIVIAYLGNRFKEEADIYPMIRVKEWGIGLILLNSGSWILYLIGYEFFFRGFLLYGALSVMDSWSAVALNAVIYALMHLHKNMRETIGSIPFGAVLAIVSLHTGSIWVGVVIHSVLAISNSLWAVKLHEDFGFTFNHHAK